MAAAIALARDTTRTGDGGPFGAVVVRDGHIIGRGRNGVTSRNDPTAHAEVEAIRAACAAINDFNLHGCELYTSCEPCPMCLGAAYWAHVDAVYYAADRTDAAAAGFDDDFIYREIAVAPEQRKLRMSQILRDRAIDVFDEWRRRENKNMY